MQGVCSCESRKRLFNRRRSKIDILEENYGEYKRKHHNQKLKRNIKVAINRQIDAFAA